ncbi:amiloride-sensitive sodium channel subunit delta [Rhinatrema bivittatum]|uniref:amiloride-sensitive sodium channel subunit delta n=1 Tax=Rhinatrema bivittatum TaxID=194408 RepID=UPI00112B7405|nr:amiloride-sensitive sodium channel subunit delta [Rhinatrema bivittatum]
MDPKAPGEKEEGLIEWFDSLQDLFQFFCNNTTIHGTIRLVCSSRNRMKTAFWTVLFLASLGLLYWQFGLLTGQYWSYPVSVSISVQSNPKAFPAVTICNMDPYRFDLVKEDLDQLDRMTQETLFSLYGYNSSGGLRADRRVTELEDLLEGGHREFNASFHLDLKIQLVKLKDDDSGPAPPGMKSSKVGFQLCNGTGADCFYLSYWSGVDALSKWYMYHYLNIMSRIPVILNITSNERVDSFIYSCKYNGKGCQRSEYLEFHHSVYGRCYTFNSEGKGSFWTATKPGVQYGLSLIVKAEQNYTPQLLSTASVRVMIHNPNQPFFMEQEALYANAGRETSIGIRQDQINRLGGSYGHCTTTGSDVGVALLYNTSYSRQACLNSCFQDKMVGQCGCAHYVYPLPPGAEYCDYNKHPGWGHCYYRLFQSLMDQSFSCLRKCQNPCQENWYKLTVGTAKYSSSVMEWWGLPPVAKSQGYKAINNTRKDVSKINVYYQELSYRTIDENPDISVSMMLSNMGNQWSWWFGSSVLSVVELGELLLDCIILLLTFTYRRFQTPRVDIEEPSAVRTMSGSLEDSAASSRRTSQTWDGIKHAKELSRNYELAPSPASGRRIGLDITSQREKCS